MKIVEAVALTIMSLLIGVFDIGVFIAAGEGFNNAVIAFVAVSFPFALLTGLFSWLIPEARWALAVAISAPVVIVCVIRARIGWVYLPGAAWTALCAVGGAYIGGRLKQPRPQISPLGSQRF